MRLAEGSIRLYSVKIGRGGQMGSIFPDLLGKVDFNYLLCNSKYFLK
jgi:hypothetical protein